MLRVQPAALELHIAHCVAFTLPSKIASVHPVTSLEMNHDPMGTQFGNLWLKGLKHYVFIDPT